MYSIENWVFDIHPSSACNVMASLPSLLLVYVLCVCGEGEGYACATVICGSQRITYWSWFFSSNMWVSGILLIF